MQTVLTIAGFDPSSGAGVTADMMVFAAHGLFGTSCITSLTVQSTLGVESSHPVEAGIVAKTLVSLRKDLPPAGIKIGMLATSEIVEAVAYFLLALRREGVEIPVVVDPVMRSSSGRELLDAQAVERLVARLLPLADWVTPNLDELALLTGRKAIERPEMLAAAQQLQERIATTGGRRSNVLAKGGHLDSPDDLLLTTEGTPHWLTGERIETTSTHGTGCALSSALLSRLVLGDAPLDAARNAKSYVTEALRRATPIGHGRGPMNLLWPML
jgi:hydroxymethylpyrimidine/phosphomethylpyrimidine kinase